MSKAKVCPICLAHGWFINETPTGLQIRACDKCPTFETDFDAIKNARQIGMVCDDNGFFQRSGFEDENEVFLIIPFKAHDGGNWVFDDSLRGLRQEPFVTDINLMIDWMVERAGITNAEKGFQLMFSANEFPGSMIHLERFEPELSKKDKKEIEEILEAEFVADGTCGAHYRCPELGVDGWLCPALLRYFQKPPDHIYGGAAKLFKAQKRKPEPSIATPTRRNEEVSMGKYMGISANGISPLSQPQTKPTNKKEQNKTYGS